jgi:hypothetical protein
MVAKELPMISLVFTNDFHWYISLVSTMVAKESPNAEPPMISLVPTNEKHQSPFERNKSPNDFRPPENFFLWE